MTDLSYTNTKKCFKWPQYRKRGPEVEYRHFGDHLKTLSKLNV